MGVVGIGSDWDKDPKAMEGRQGYRGFYTAAKIYQSYFRAIKTILRKSAAVSKLLLLTKNLKKEQG